MLMGNGLMYLGNVYVPHKKGASRYRTDSPYSFHQQEITIVTSGM